MSEKTVSNSVGKFLENIDDPLAWSPSSSGTKMYAPSRQGMKNLCGICFRRKDDCWDTGENKKE